MLLGGKVFGRRRTSVKSIVVGTMSGVEDGHLRPRLNGTYCHASVAIDDKCYYGFDDESRTTGVSRARVNTSHETERDENSFSWSLHQPIFISVAAHC